MEAVLFTQNSVNASARRDFWQARAARQSRRAMTTQLPTVQILVGCCDEGLGSRRQRRDALRPCCAEPSGECAEDIAIGTCRGQIDADAGRALYHARRDLDRRTRIVANSAVDTGERFGAALRMPSMSQ